MRVRSLGYRTDLALLRYGGKIEDRGEYLVARTPTQPTFYWGNLLLFPEPPRTGDVERWGKLFEREFAQSPETRHRAFGWDDPEGRHGAAAEFLGAGYALEDGIVMSAREVAEPPHPRRDLELRPLTSDRDWEAAWECQLECRDPSYATDTHARFLRGFLAERRAMTEKGLGRWFGAFDEEGLLGNLGLYLDGDVARFQSVATATRARRRGVCGTLVHHASRWALTEARVRTLVMVADAAEDAQRVYRALGFADTERQVGLLKRPEPSTSK